MRMQTFLFAAVPLLSSLFLDSCVEKETAPIHALRIEKRTNGYDAATPPGPPIVKGSVVRWEYTITNTGDVPLTKISVDDDREGHIGDIPSLAPGESRILSQTGTAVLGQYQNRGTVTGGYYQELIMDQDSSHYLGTPVPVLSIDIEKNTNDLDADTPPGPSVTEGSSVRWGYRVTNTGNVSLTKLSVDDDREGHIGDIDSLAPGDSQTLNHAGTAILGQYENRGTACGTYLEQTVTDQDDSHYYGTPIPNPSLGIVKHTNGREADTPPGPSVTQGSSVRWDYIVTNTGNVTLTDISVDDDVEGHVGDISSLAPGESRAVSDSATAILGLYRNLGIARGQHNQETVTAQDASCYRGTPPPLPAFAGLIVYYPFNGNANDESGNGFHGTVMGATLTSDRLGNENSAYAFNGTSDYISVPDEIFGPSIPEFTISCWIKLGENMPDGTARRIYHKGTVNGDMYLFLTQENAIAFVAASNNLWEAVDSPFQGDTAHIVGLYRRGKSMEIWINGSRREVIEIPEYDLTTDPWSRSSIGACNRGQNEFWKGVIDDIRIYTRALSNDEINLLYHEGE